MAKYTHLSPCPSAQGQNRIVTLILPTERATPLAFYHELDRLMDLATIQGKI